MSTALTAEQTIVEFDQEIEIRAARERVFEGLLHRLSDGHCAPGDTPLPLVLEARAGGRWYRDLGDGQGHLWGFVQSFKPPELIEFFGPMFMSYPVSGHLIIRVEEDGDSSRLHLKHSAFGLILEEHRAGLKMGWGEMLAGLRATLEA